MRLLLLSAIAIFFVGLPLLALEVARNYSRWIDEHHGGVSIVAWLLLLLALYFLLLPRLGLQPNWRVLAP